MRTSYLHLSVMQPVLLAIGVSIILAGCKKNNTSVPVITTDPPTEVTTTTAKSGGLVISDGGASILEHGVCYKPGLSPTIADGKVSAGAGAGSFVVTLTGLTPDTRYHIRTYATNEAGTGYGEELVLQTMYGTVTDIDGTVYPTVRAGEQVWMAKNLSVRHYRNGTVIPEKPDYSQWNQVTYGAYAWYANDYDLFGRYYGPLYNWYAISDERGLCPEGWHVPTIGEWDTLFVSLGGNAVAGGKMKSALTALYQHPCWLPPNYLGTNESGFSAFPGGFRSYTNSAFDQLGNGGYWWSSTPDSLGFRGILLNTYFSGVIPGILMEHSGVSVRCLKD